MGLFYVSPLMSKHENPLGMRLVSNRECIARESLCKM